MRLGIEELKCIFLQTKLSNLFGWMMVLLDIVYVYGEAKWRGLWIGLEEVIDGWLEKIFEVGTWKCFCVEVEGGSLLLNASGVLSRRSIKKDS